MKSAWKTGLVIALLATVPAMAQLTFIGTNSNDCSDWLNWNPAGLVWGSAGIIDNNCPYNELVDTRGYMNPSYLTLNRDAGVTLGSIATLASGGVGGITVMNAATYTVGTINNCEGGTVTFDIAQGGTLNISDSRAILGNITFTGAGTLNIANYSKAFPWVSAWNFASANLTTKISRVANTYGNPGDVWFIQPISDMTGVAGANVTLTGNYNIRAGGFSFPGTITLTPSTNGACTLLSFTDVTTADYNAIAAASVSGVHMNLAGKRADTALRVLDNQTFVDSTFTGDGYIYATDNDQWPGSGNATTMTLKGGSLTPSLTGVLTVLGNIQFDKNASNKNAKLVVSVTGTGGQVGTDYTRLSVESASVITSVSSATNALADADLVVNITPNMNNTLLAGQALTIMECKTNLSSSSFGNVSVVGGTATVSYLHTDTTYAYVEGVLVTYPGRDWVELSNIVSNASSTPTSALTANPLTGATLGFASNLPDRAKTLTSAVTLTNSGDAGTTLKITGVAITGANASNFAFSGAVNDVLPATPGQAYNVQFLGAHLPGTYTATLTVTTDAAKDNVVSYTLSAVVARLIGDANLDNHVNFTDYLALEQTFNTAVANDTGADFTKDGLVNFSDYLALEQNFNTSGAAVPEPMTLSLLGLGALALIRRRK